MNLPIAIALGYLLGSIPVARLVAGRHGVDLLARGDGNPGAWNALVQLGARRAWPVFAGDGAKALAAALAGRTLGGWWVGWAAVIASMIGHAVPIFAHGRGGKGVMCFAGGVIGLSPVAAAVCLAVVAVMVVVRRGALGARIGVFLFPVVQLLTDPVTHVEATGVLMTLIGVLFLARRRRPGLASGGSAVWPRG
jgi:glycerol-3-phosphate acyltransferase PlsY